jgi:GR25 family glycosyltransferase involved in LPS biosynthesis
MIAYFVINLDRRPDRLESFTENFAGHSPKISRISAVDGQSNTFTNPPSLLSLGEQGCWASHQKIMKQFISLGQEYCVILEDDAKLSCRPGLDFGSIVSSAIELMKVEELGILQLGTIKSLYKLSSRHGFGYFLSEWIRGTKSRKVIVSGVGQRLYKHQYRAGTHAYIINRSAAMLLHDTNTPAVFPADSFYGFLAKASNHENRRGTLWFGTLSPGLIDQISREGGRSLDSDVSETISAQIR